MNTEELNAWRHRRATLPYDSLKMKGDDWFISATDISPSSLLEIVRLLVKDGFTLGIEADFDRVYADWKTKPLMVAFDHPTDPKNYFVVADKGDLKSVKIKRPLRETDTWPWGCGWDILAIKK